MEGYLSESKLFKLDLGRKIVLMLTLMINELSTAKKKKNNSDYEMTLQSRWQGPYGAPKAFAD